MKKTLYLGMCIIFALICRPSTAHAQYHITSTNLNHYLDSFCSDPTIFTITSGYATTLNVTTYFGDGTSSNNPVGNYSGGQGYISLGHGYSAAGTYTIKQVLYDGTTPQDSVVASFDYFYCNTFIIKAYNDLNNNCTFDSLTETYMTVPMTVQVDSDGHHIDTLVTTSGFYYPVRGVPGTVYTFTILSLAPGGAVTCPGGGVITQTIQPVVNGYSTASFAVSCTGASGLDLAEYVNEIAGRHLSDITITVNNSYCTAQNATLTMHFSPKYNFTSSNITPASVTGNTVVWNIANVSLVNSKTITARLEVPSTWLIPGDTVQTSFYLTPTAGDLDVTNNTIIRVDTVTGSYDPNEKSVTPQGNIRPGTKLTYTIGFENTGNDTAFNIHVMDTLSNNVDPKTLNIVAATAAMNVSILNDGTHNIAKFDFPHINLLDSTHIGMNTGFFTYTINAKEGLPNGTKIDNEAGIYFDYNSVVMTNNVENIIGTPAGIALMSNAAKVSVYPNPVDEELIVQTDNAAYSTMSITNTIGQVVMTQSITNAQTKVNVHTLPTGIYYITLRGNSGIKTIQFEKQ